MRPLRRDELLSPAAYEAGRELLRPSVLALRAARRLDVGPDLTLLFENRLLARYHLQEVLRLEPRLDEAVVTEELARLNLLLGAPNELPATLLVGIPDPERRRRELPRLVDAPARLYLRLGDGRRLRARCPHGAWEARPVGVHFLLFPAPPTAPVAVGLEGRGADPGREVALGLARRRALAADRVDLGASALGAAG